MKFQIFKNGQVAEKFRLCGAFLFGTDGIGVRRTKIAFKDGLLECGKPNLETAGLALLWPVDGFGRVLLPTTCLPERQRQYNLNLEMARARLMQIINKREDWSYFSPVEDLDDLSNEAQNLFIQAVQNGSNALLASQLADESLKKALVFSEKLAMEQAESLFAVRVKNRAFGRGCLGCRVNPAQIRNPKYIEKLLDVFGSVIVPINWAQIETQKGAFDFSTLDACVELLCQKKLVLGAGPLLRFSRGYLPKWLLRGGMGFEKIRDTAYQFVSSVVARYTGPFIDGSL